MGNPASKIGEHVKEEQPTKGAVPSTPILTPKVKTLEGLDPRSPSANIVRTPIQTLLSPNRSKKEVEETDENKFDTFNINSPTPPTLLDDPRSPTVDFTRTPIVLDEPEKLPAKLHNKNLDNVRKTLLINVTPKKIPEVTNIVPPKLLNSSPIVAKPCEKRRSYVGLLETNIDYVETDLDEVIQSKLAIKPQEMLEDNEGSEGESKEELPIQGKLAIKLQEDVPEENKGSEGESQSRLAIKLQEDVAEKNEVNVGHSKVAPEDEPEDCPKLVVDSELPNENEPENCTNIVVDDDGLINVPNKIEQQLPKVINLTPKLIEKRSKLLANVADFDKKISTLIYTDDDADADVVVKPTVVKEGNRTPLGIHNGQPKSRLKVSDRPRKLEYAVSKIPVFREKSTKKSQQSENVPPKTIKHFHGKPTINAQWDGDNTLII